MARACPLAQQCNDLLNIIYFIIYILFNIYILKTRGVTSKKTSDFLSSKYYFIGLTNQRHCKILILSYLLVLTAIDEMRVNIHE